MTQYDTPRIERRPEVEARTGISKPTIYALIRKGQFPRPIRLSAQSVGWLSSEIDAWIASRVAERDAKPARIEVPCSSLP